MLAHPKIDTPKYAIYCTYMGSLDSPVSGEFTHIYFIEYFLQLRWPNLALKSGHHAFLVIR